MTDYGSYRPSGSLDAPEDRLDSSIDTASGDIMPSPFEEEIAVSPSDQNTSENVREFYFLLEENCPPFYNRGDRVSSQFSPQDFQINRSATTASSAGYSSTNPIVQWISGGQETTTFGMRLFSRHSEDRTAEEKYNMMQDLSTPIPEKHRPPLVSFFWGQVIPDGIPCIIKSVNNRFDETRPDGTIRGVTIDITLERREEFYLVQESTEPQERTPTRIAKHGDTYELIAEDEYGDPMYGVLLRRMNTRKVFDDSAPRLVADLEPGDKVKIFPKRDMQSAGRIQPECFILGSSLNSLQARAILFRTRGEKIGYFPRR